MKEYLFPTSNLPFQLGREGVPLAEWEAIDVLPGGFGAGRRPPAHENEIRLAAGPLP
jgi:hypothetical protein